MSEINDEAPLNVPNNRTSPPHSHIVFNSKQQRLDLLNRIEKFLTSKFSVSCGRDTNDNDYESPIDFWTDRGLLNGDDDDTDAEKTRKKELDGWYNKSYDYWQNQGNVPATIDGMLGGFSHLSERDLIASNLFVQTLIKSNKYLMNLRREPDDLDACKHIECRSCECGAGIGRVTKGLMIPLGIEKFDLVETSPRLLKYAPGYIGRDSVDKCTLICQGLQDFHPDENTYDVIWVQWVIGYLSDWDLVSFLNRMGRALKKGGVIILKDNTCSQMAFLADCNDSDITRSVQYLMAIVKESKLRVAVNDRGDQFIKWQSDFPDDIWPVPMIALEPDI